MNHHTDERVRRLAAAVIARIEANPGFDPGTIVTRDEVMALVHCAKLSYQSRDGCECLACIRARGDMVGLLPKEFCYMIVCPKCGDKRCPCAAYHGCACVNEKVDDADLPRLSDLRGTIDLGGKTATEFVRELRGTLTRERVARAVERFFQGPPRSLMGEWAEKDLIAHLCRELGVEVPG